VSRLWFIGIEGPDWSRWLGWGKRINPSGLELFFHFDSQFASILKGPERLEFNLVKNSRI